MSGPIEYLAELANGDTQLFVDLVSQFHLAVQSDSRIRYEYDTETYTYNLDLAQMNAKGRAGWEVIQIFKDVGSNGISSGGVFGTMNVYQVLYKRPWVIAQLENINER